MKLSGSPSLGKGTTVASFDTWRGELSAGFFDLEMVYFL